MRSCRPAPARDGRASRTETSRVADARARSAGRTRRSAGRAARMPEAPEPPRSGGSAHPAAPARRNAAVLRGHADPARLNPMRLRRHVAARRSLASGPRRLPARHRPRLRAPRRLLQNARSLPPRHLSVLPDRPPRSASGTVIVPPPNALDSSHLLPEPRREHRLRRRSRPHLRPRPSSGLRRVRLVRPMRSGPPARVTPSDQTVIASAPAISVPGRTRPPRPQPRRLPRLPRRPLLRRRHRLLRQRGPSLRHQSRPRRNLGRQPPPRPSRWMRPAFESRIFVASVGSAVKAIG